jgi:hypothetical protein
VKKRDRDKPKKKYPDVWSYTDMHYAREIHRDINGAKIQLQDYKGHILLCVEPLKPTKTEMLAQRAGVTVGDDAWLDGDSLDALITMLREAKRTWLKHYRWMQRVAKCKACKDVFMGMCKKHARKESK